MLGHYLCLECACCTPPCSRKKLYLVFSSPYLSCLTRMDKGLSFSLYLPLWHASGGPSPPLTSFWRNVIPAMHFPKRGLSRNPKIDPFFSPLPNHTLSIPWPWAHLSCIGWVQVGGVPVLVCVFHYPLHLSSFTLTLFLLFLLFLPCRPIGLFTSFFGLPRLIYFTFTFYYAYGPAGCYSCHVGP